MDWKPFTLHFRAIFIFYRLAELKMYHTFLLKTNTAFDILFGIGVDPFKV